MFLPKQKYHSCKLCGQATLFGEHLCQSHGPDLEFDNAVEAFYNATVKDGFCKICGEEAPPNVVVEESFILGDYIAHLPGCFFGRQLKVNDFVGD